MAVQVESLRSTCSLTEVILMGKDIELLLLKKEVQEKLDSLSAISVKNLPPTTSKRVEFVAGDVDLGYIHDYDRPLLSKLRPRRTNTTELGTESTSVSIETSSVATQTDRQHKHSSSSSSSSSSDSDSDSSDSSDSDSDDAGAKNKKTSNEVELVEAEVQTDPQSRWRSSSSSSSSSSSDEETSKVEQGTMTDQVSAGDCNSVFELPQGWGV